MIIQNAKKLLLMTMALFLLSFTAILTSGSSSLAETNTPELTDENLFEAQYVNDVYTITKFKGQNLTEIVVPASIDGRKVQAIGAYAFNGAGNIHSLYLPDSLEIIGENAFYAYPIDSIGSYTYTMNGDFIDVDSSSVETAIIETPSVETASVTTCSSLPKSLTTIGKNAFTNSGIKNIIINSNLSILGESAFENTGNFLDFTINAGASISEIGSYAFRNSGIHTFTVNGLIEKIGANAFEGTGNFDKFVVNEGGSITEIGASVFENSGIHYVTLRGTVSSIGDRAFASCGNILDVTVESSTPYTLGEYAFNNAGIHSVNFSNGLSVVSKGCFEGCGNLETVNLPETLTYIEEDAFKNVSNIKKITINDTATVAPNAFVGAGGSTLQALAATNNANVKNAVGITSTPINTTNVSAIVPTIAPTAPQKITVAAVKLKKAKVNKKKKSVTLTWTKNKKASGYTIYKKVVKKGKKAGKVKFKKFKNVSKKRLKLTIKLAKKSTTYFYVKAYVKTKVNGKTVTTYSKASNTKKTALK